jgi:hypothetical protein
MLCKSWKQKLFFHLALRSKSTLPLFISVSINVMPPLRPFCSTNIINKILCIREIVPYTSNICMILVYDTPL